MRSAVSADHLRRDLVAHGTSHIASCPAVATPQAPLEPWALARDGPGTHTLAPCHDWRDRVPGRERAKNMDMVRTHVHLLTGEVLQQSKIATALWHPRWSRAGPDSAPVRRATRPRGTGYHRRQGGVVGGSHAAIVPLSPSVWQRAASPLPNALRPPRRKQRGSLSAFRAMGRRSGMGRALMFPRAAIEEARRDEATAPRHPIQGSRAGRAEGWPAGERACSPLAVRCDHRHHSNPRPRRDRRACIQRTRISPRVMACLPVSVASLRTSHKRAGNCDRTRARSAGPGCPPGQRTRWPDVTWITAGEDAPWNTDCLKGSYARRHAGADATAVLLGRFRPGGTRRSPMPCARLRPPGPTRPRSMPSSPTVS